MLSFSLEEFLVVLENYNVAIWPLQIIAYSLILLVLFILLLATGLSAQQRDGKQRDEKWGNEKQSGGIGQWHGCKRCKVAHVRNDNQQPPYCVQDRPARLENAPSAFHVDQENRKTQCNCRAQKNQLVQRVCAGQLLDQHVVDGNRQNGRKNKEYAEA